jgi:hypothetical protein
VTAWPHGEEAETSEAKGYSRHFSGCWKARQSPYQPSHPQYPPEAAAAVRTVEATAPVSVRVKMAWTPGTLDQ